MSGTLMQPESDRSESHAWSLDQDAAQPYRAMSKAAVFALCMTLLSVLALAAPALVILPVLGVVFGLIGLANVRRFPEELSGRGVAVFATLVCVIVAIGASLWHSYVYATEVPPGFARISFRVLQDHDNPMQPQPPAEALQLDGQKIFIKGYIHPDAGMAPVSQFVLVPDMGTCCFGGQPKLTDMIQVKLSGKQKVRYSTRRCKLAGKLAVNPELTPVPGYIGVYYTLDATHVK